MAGLVPAIHVLQYHRIQREHNVKDWPRAWKVRLIVAANPEWNDLFETIAT